MFGSFAMLLCMEAIISNELNNRSRSSGSKYINISKVFNSNQTIWGYIYIYIRIHFLLPFEDDSFSLKAQTFN